MFPEPPRTPRPSPVLWPHVLSSQVNPRTHRLAPCRTGEPRGAPEPGNQDALRGQPSSPSPAGDWMDPTLRGAIYTRPAFQSVLRPSLLPSSPTPGSSRPLVTHSCPFQSLPVSFLLRVLLAPSSPFPPAVFLRWWFTCSVVSDSCDPKDCRPQVPLTMGILQARVLQCSPCPPPWDFPDPGIEAGSPTLQAKALQTEVGGKPWFFLKTQDFHAIHHPATTPTEFCGSVERACRQPLTAVSSAICFLVVSAPE